MSHPSKVSFLKKAYQSGYRCHLYFVSTESPIINKERVAARVQKGGHSVDPVKIEERYYRSLELVAEMIRWTNECYLYDNSGLIIRLFAQIQNGKGLIRIDNKTYPRWFKKYLYAKGFKP